MKLKHMSAAEIMRFRDRILESIIVGVAETPALSKSLVLRGGGALHFVYSSPRISSDLDFAAQDFVANYDAFRSVSENMILVVEGNAVRPNPLQGAFTDTRKTLRYSFMPVDGPSLAAQLELEGIRPGETLISSGKYAPLLVATPRQIYADKIIAALRCIKERGRLKPTDLFDLDWLANNFREVESSEDLITRRAADYDGDGFSKENCERVVSFIEDRENHPYFHKRLEQTTEADYFKQNTFDSSYFTRTAQHFHRLRSRL